MKELHFTKRRKSMVRHRARRGAIFELAAQLLAPKLIVDVVIALYTATMSALVTARRSTA